MDARRALTHNGSQRPCAVVSTKPGWVTVAFRDGSSAQGQLQVEAVAFMGFFAYPATAEMANMAVLNGASLASATTAKCPSQRQRNCCTALAAASSCRRRPRGPDGRMRLCSTTRP